MSNYWVHPAETLEEMLSEPEAPAKCATCGGSMYLNDRDDDGRCDTCSSLDGRKTITFEESERRKRKIAGSGF